MHFVNVRSNSKLLGTKQWHIYKKIGVTKQWHIYKKIWRDKTMAYLQKNLAWQNSGISTKKIGF